ncbi:efflux RND transporter periplasmic adaptor subunit [Teredinibacter sp. KSP-S5-2]|uniref:efflux RND transporter periplasmic adaptor subunit n=1 Tax=Teredinibacter sp. KSP-S5-2 TaxID=3034506 RepID=UPI00293432C9|nr:efflux RND transporter periplasmic adaptor subunit [Teredinibacter sp. KSP-S5-2]WNO10150.1 efflux RND transporter periplasmic adaptor subunit [Teredinibacter sp. KSP-S5-2]
MNSNYRLALFLSVLTVLWVASGYVRQNKLEKDAELAEQSKNASVFTVQAEYHHAREYQRGILARGKTEANRTVAVMAEIDGVVVSTPATEGTWVEEGSVLCELDSEDRALKLAQAKASLEKAKLDYQGALKLKDGGYQSKSQIAAAKSSLVLAEATLKRATLELDRLTIEAPFSGIIERREAEAGDFLQRGQPCASLVELSPLVVAAQISEDEVMQLDRGAQAKVHFISGETLDGTLRFIGHTSDPLTRTFRIEVVVPNADLVLKAGLTADITVATRSEVAHLISPSLLSLEDSGKIAVRILDESEKVRSVSVNLIGDDKDGVWVTGLPENVLLITVGQEYVSEGQQVKVVINGEESSKEGDDVLEASVVGIQ